MFNNKITTNVIKVDDSAAWEIIIEGVILDQNAAYAATAAVAVNTALDLLPAWTAETVLVAGAAYIPSTGAAGFYYTPDVAGTTGLVEPTWPTTDLATVVEGAITWTAHAVVAEEPEDATYTAPDTTTVTLYKRADGGYEFLDANDHKIVSLSEDTMGRLYSALLA